MHVRPFFWIFLATVCVSVLIFAATISAYRMMPMRVSIDQVSITGVNATMVRLHLTDPDGMPIDQASITPDAYMLDMAMRSKQISTRALGQGIYLALIHFSMAGPWNIDIIAHASGFNVTRQSIKLNIP